MVDGVDEAMKAGRRGQLVGVVFLLAAILVAVLVGSGALSGDDPAKDASVVDGVKGTKETTALFRGVPQKGIVLGDPNAPVTVVEFVDVKCPVCKSFALKNGSDIVDQLVRPGKANLELRLIGVIDMDQANPDTLLGRTAVNALAADGKAWDLAELLFYNQQSEGKRWVTPALLNKVAAASPDLKGTTITTTPTAATTALAAQTDAIRKALDVNATPTIYVRPRGKTATGDYRKVDLKGTGSNASKVRSAVEDLGS